MHPSGARRISQNLAGSGVEVAVTRIDKNAITRRVRVGQPEVIAARPSAFMTMERPGARAREVIVVARVDQPASARRPASR